MLGKTKDSFSLQVTETSSNDDPTTLVLNMRIYVDDIIVKEEVGGGNPLPVELHHVETNTFLFNSPLADMPAHYFKRWVSTNHGVIEAGKWFTEGTGTGSSYVVMGIIGIILFIALLMSMPKRAKRK